jgi:hypothetical protein
VVLGGRGFSNRVSGLSCRGLRNGTHFAVCVSSTYSEIRGRLGKSNAVKRSLRTCIDDMLVCVWLSLLRRWAASTSRLPGNVPSAAK